MTSPEPTVIDVTLPKKVAVFESAMTGLVMFGFVVMMGFLLWQAFSKRDRSNKNQAEFRQPVHTAEQRDETISDAAPAKDGEEYNASACGPECVQGHTYRDGCIQYVAPESSADAETV
jgi:cytoskeletal protein RodZ